MTTLIDYYIQTFQPLRCFQNEWEARLQVLALRHLDEFAPAKPIQEITHDLMQKFEAWSYERVGVKHTYHNLRCINQILNHYHGMKGKRRPQAAAWGKVDDSEVWRFMLEAYKPRKLPNAAASTMNQYRTNISRLSALVGHPATLADLTDDNISQLMTQLVTEGRSPTTANGLRAKLLALARFAARRGLIKQAPEVSKLSQYRRLPVSWTADEFGRLLDSCLLETGEIDRIPAKLWWYAIHLVLFDTGARLGAVLKIKQADVDLSKATVFVLAEHQKHKADQLWHLHEQTTTALRRIWLPDRWLLFPWPLCEASLFGHYRRVLQRAGLPFDRVHKFHAIRRTHATMLANVAGLGAASLSLGHSSSDVTREHYLDPSAMSGAVAHLPRPVLKLPAKGGAA